MWIGSSHPFDLHEAYLCFRRAFTLDHAPAGATLRITADSRYKLRINGAFVARGPARCYPDAQSVDTLDVTHFLRVGRNLIAVQVYQPGYSHFAYVHRGAAGLWAELEFIESRASRVGDAMALNGSPRSQETLWISTDQTWRVRRDPSFRELVPRVSIYGSGIEIRDLARDDPWQDPAYDDSNWDTPRIVAPSNGYPWTKMKDRELPLLVEREQAMALLDTRRGASFDSVDDIHLALRQGWMAASRVENHPDPDGWFDVSLEQGESAYWLYDLGRDYIGQGWAEIRGASGTEHLSISYQEKIRHGELVISDPQTYCRVRLTDGFALRAGDQVAETLALRGGRYFLLQLTGPTVRGLTIRFHARVSEYPLTITRPLSAPDPLLSRIIDMCEETFRACLQDGFIDSTWRESSQWTGDALTQAVIMSSMTDDVRPLRRVIEMAAHGAYPDAVLPSVLPGEVHAYAVVDYNFMWVELLALHWRLTRDAEFLHAHWQTLVKMLDRFAQDVNADSLILSQPGRRLFLDWSPQSRGEPSAVYNLHYLLALQAAAGLADALGESEQAAHWRERATVSAHAIRSNFLHDGRWYDDLPRSTFSQLAASLAILTGAAPPEEHPTLSDSIAARSLDPDDAPAPDKLVLASPFMHHYVFEALRQAGRDEAVIDIIKRRWGRWVEGDFPTTWENWSVDFPDGSQCHAFSAHPRHHLAELAASTIP